MSMKVATLFILFIISRAVVIGQPANITQFIKVDQFGYLCDARKIAVITDPIIGFNSADSFNPGTTSNNYQVRDWNTNTVVFQGAISSWNGGATHGQSGDKGWYFDFSSVNDPGIYYIFDVSNNVGSGQFFIGSNVYNDALRAVSRTYFYQRCNFAKNTPFAAPEYTDAAAYEGSNQDKFARSSLDKSNASTARDVSGGWFDAGDMNKYVTFCTLPMLSLLDSYNKFPNVFGDNNNIPESGNGIPDIMDEVKFELEWLKKMQDGSGTNGLLLKVGADSYSCVNSPPSADVCPRYYIPECSSATICGAVIFASAYKTFINLPGQTAFANDLLTRAQNAWTRASGTTSNFTSFQQSCDNGDIKSGDADMDATTQMQYAMAAAIYLYAATGNSIYSDFVNSRYSNINPMSSGWWGPYDTEYGRALLFYASLPSVNATIKNNIRNSKANSGTGMGLNEYLNNQDLYRSHMPDAQYHWGSNQVKAYIGAQQIDYITNNLNTSDHDNYYFLASEYLHYFHGVNPLGMTFLSNMYDLHAEKCANEIYHGWFGDGTQFDNALTSPFGPPPGYITGGANGDFSVGGISPPQGQPRQKSYKDWNTGWNGTMNENSWEITEPSIYVQAAYINLLSSVIGTSDQGMCEAIILATNTLDFIVNPKNNGVEIRWTAMENAVSYEVQRSEDVTNFQTVFNKGANSKESFSIIDKPLSDAERLFYRLKIYTQDGNSEFSKVQSVKWSAEKNIQVIQDYASNTLKIRLGKSALSKSMEVSILDMVGNVVYKNNYSNSAEISIKTDKWNTGFYFVQISKSDSNPIVEKIFIQGI